MMKTFDAIFYAIPVFILAMLVEIIWTQRTRKHQYRVNDTFTCLTASIISSQAGVYGAGLITFCYLLIFNHYHMIDMRHLSTSLQIVCVASLVVLQDFFYYWFHRAAHRINLLWASHITHHSSEEYNFAVALRQSTFQQFFSWPVYLPLAIIGYPAEWLALVTAINLIYQFWLHTREIDRFPWWIEAVFNTPSHHRVHHGTNTQYLDKNYGGMLIIWDRLFGTFEPEIEEVRYGITVPLTSYNPIWANLHYFWFLIKTSLSAPDIHQVMKLWLAPPDWNPEWKNQNTPITKCESTS
jgi:alkylglycerol monooxygenase